MYAGQKRISLSDARVPIHCAPMTPPGERSVFPVGMSMQASLPYLDGWPVGSLDPRKLMGQRAPES